MRRRRNNSILIAGLLAILSALGLIAIVSLSNGSLKNLDPTDYQHTLDSIVLTRVAETAAARTLAVATEAVTQKSP